MRVVERSFSEFLRQPNDVVAELDDHDVVLRRRNAPSLRLSDASRDDERAQTFDAIARLLRNLLVHRPAGLQDAVVNVFPWSRFLPSRERTAFCRYSIDDARKTVWMTDAHVGHPKATE